MNQRKRQELDWHPEGHYASMVWDNGEPTLEEAGFFRKWRLSFLADASISSVCQLLTESARRGGCIL